MGEMQSTSATDLQRIVSSISISLPLMIVKKQLLLILSTAKLMAEWGNPLFCFTQH
jgi:hypothetical protein